MSTNATIARYKGPGRFEGRYHHWDGYPSGLGKTLFDLYNGFFERDLGRMLKVLIDDHTGWSTINDKDFRREPGFVDLSLPGDSRYERLSGRPMCYCHGDRHEEGWLEDETNAQQWVYVFASDGGGAEMLIRYEGHIVANIDLHGDEPDWERIENDLDAVTA